MRQRLVLGKNKKIRSQFMGIDIPRPYQPLYLLAYTAQPNHPSIVSAMKIVSMEPSMRYLDICKTTGQEAGNKMNGDGSYPTISVSLSSNDDLSVSSNDSTVHNNDGSLHCNSDTPCDDSRVGRSKSLPTTSDADSPRDDSYDEFLRFCGGGSTSASSSPTSEQDSKENQPLSSNNEPEEDDGSFIFSYGTFNVHLSKEEIEKDPHIFTALTHTPQLKCDERVLRMKMERARLMMRVATKFGSVRHLNSTPMEEESRRKSSSDSLFGQARRQSLRQSTIALFENPSELEDQLLGSIDEDNTNWLMPHEKCQNWIRSFQGLDPRHQILEFFNDLALEGVDKFEKQGSELSGQKDKPKILKAFVRNGIFTVWRPTSNDAIRKMITGEGTGKGLDIKGKSAKCGAFSGYVPFLQIHENEHKSKISQMRLHERVRVFYPNKASRDVAATVLNMLSRAMMLAGSSSNADGESSSTSGGGAKSKWSKLSTKSLGHTDNAMATIASNHARTNPQVFKIDDYVESQSVYGLDIPEQLFWEGYVTPNDITRPKGSKYETGRPSMPEFQQMNIETLRNWEPCDTDPTPRPVLWHGDCGRLGEDAPEEYNPMCPRGLLMAYEENEKVIPVVSDFDCFLLGTRGVRYTEPLGEQEHTMLSQCVDDIEGILETPKEGSNWTQRWLGVKKQHAMEMSEDEPSQEMPKFGYADPRSYKVMTGAVNRLKSNGAVRHGPECFNYGFPQDLDDQYLVVSDTFWGVPWRYVNSEGLIDILSAKVEEGFTFPLNPKWVLCDQGWKNVYDKLLASEKDNTLDARTKANMVSSMAIWYPDTIRKRIEEISTKYPDGFVDTCVGDQSSGVQIDLAMLEFKKYQNQVVAEKKMQRLLTKQRGSRRSIVKALSTIESKATDDLQTIEEGTKNNPIRTLPRSRSVDRNTEGDSSANSRKSSRSMGFIKRLSGGSGHGSDESSEATTGRSRSVSRLQSFRLALNRRVSD